MMLAQHGIQNRPTTSKNPQANSVCERLHQTVANILRTTLRARPPQDLQSAQEIVDDSLAIAMHATRCSVSSSLHSSPGALVFRRDMFVDVPLIGDLLTIQQHRQHIIDENLRRQNQRRREYHYRLGDSVLVKAINPSKLDERAVGPFPIAQVYTNGTVDIQRNPHVTERINIRRLVPYKQPTA
jgi:hypothetical protein